MLKWEENLFLMLNKNKIIVTGGSGRFGSVLRKYVKKNYFFPKKNELNILNLKSIISYNNFSLVLDPHLDEYFHQYFFYLFFFF